MPTELLRRAAAPTVGDDGRVPVQRRSPQRVLLPDAPAAPRPIGR
ncbi:hypothetical protein [Micromonospora okii]|nr:hypothetical protein [Micromonospora okii]